MDDNDEHDSSVSERDNEANPDHQESTINLEADIRKGYVMLSGTGVIVGVLCWFIGFSLIILSLARVLSIWLGRIGAINALIHITRDCRTSRLPDWARPAPEKYGQPDAAGSPERTAEESGG